MTVYIGVDFHARKWMLSYLTTEDGEIQQIALLHEQDDVRGFYVQWERHGQNKGQLTTRAARLRVHLETSWTTRLWLCDAGA